MEAFLYYFLSALFVITPISVYLDATKNNIGQVGKVSFLSIPAGGWALLNIALLGLGLPIYLLKRKALLAIAAKNPVRLSKNHILMVSLVIVSISILLAFG